MTTESETKIENKLARIDITLGETIRTLRSIATAIDLIFTILAEINHKLGERLDDDEFGDDGDCLDGDFGDAS